MSAPADRESSESEAHLDGAYNKAIAKKLIFKEYLARHKIIENMNAAIAQLFESPQLPDDPNEFIAAYIRKANPE
jgi:hypothetical protein